MTQKERQERSRKEIYQAALEEFGTYGYDKVNMERICGNHGISKGMMYHYYSGKDDLFLLCVEDTFCALKSYIEQYMAQSREPDAVAQIKNFFMIREYFLQLHPERKLIFETAVLRPPDHLHGQIQKLWSPLRQLNREFLEQVADSVPLRPCLAREDAARYLECAGTVFRSVLRHCCGDNPPGDLHTLLESAGGALDMLLFGVLKQDDAPKRDCAPE